MPCFVSEEDWAQHTGTAMPYQWPVLPDAGTVRSMNAFADGNSLEPFLPSDASEAE